MHTVSEKLDQNGLNVATKHEEAVVAVACTYF